MMQFLGPFMASFYPFQNSALDALLPATSESDGSNHMGIVAQFFPHATSMVSRLNSSQNAVTTAPTPVLLDPVLEDSRLEIERLQSALPLFLQATRRSAHALRSVRQHRYEQAPPHKDLEAIVNGLLDYFAALAIVQTGDENTDAEMRVYCAYSFPAVVLLLGPENWPGALKTCFFTLLNPSYADDDEDDDEDEVAKQEKKETEPPLPVKRCLASSLHTVAHILGPDIAAIDILPVFCDYFLKDADEAVRLNIIRGFPAFLGNLPADRRSDVFLQWSEIMHGEDCLGAKKRSATNPLVLNWRQRDYLARSLPDLLGLVPPDLVHAHIWPIVHQLLNDSVSLVRDDALWTVPVLFKFYTPDTAAQWPSAKKFVSKTAVLQIVTWFKENILKIGASNGASLRKSSSGVSERSGSGSSVANFSDRQLYCRVCGTVGLALRLNEEIRASAKKDLAAALGESFVGLFFGGATSTNKTADDPPLDMPYQKLSSAEHKHMKKILEEQLLPHALSMKDDHIRNVRVTLLKVLEILPIDMKESPNVKTVLQTLQQEVSTWESFGDEASQFVPTPQPQQAPVPPQATPEKEKTRPASPKKGKRSSRDRSVKKERIPAKDTGSPSSGPVDVDEVVITPTNSKDDEDDDQSAEGDDADAQRNMRKSKKKKPKKEPISEKKRKPKKVQQRNEQDGLDQDDNSSYGDYDKKWKGTGGDGGGRAVIDVDPLVPASISGDEEEGGGPPISVIVDQEAEAREVEKHYDEKQKSFNNSMNKELAVVHDHAEDAPISPERIKIESSFEVKALPDIPGSEGIDRRKKLTRTGSGRSRGSKNSRGSKGSKSSRSGSPMKGMKQKSKKNFIETIDEGAMTQSPKLVDKESVAPGGEEFFNAEALAGWKTVIFEDGPIGLQLEPTANDLACRVYGFLESGSARKSGKIELGDVIVKVNGAVVKNYDETVDMLKRGGRRSVTFRPGAVTDDYADEGDFDDSGDLTSDEDDDDDEPRKAKKRTKKREKAAPKTSKTRRKKKGVD
uniref:PDZ domain-containing protein n=1 Tax=Entomoneis paludosa TaxID=265537 RepID=A0A7S2YP65_9STRA|mmetsp:Transcript_40632/g.84578  ORF Transcript_40632/g.84578 Transcript_40632/m.84578 type:complete len:1019 (+) Transcript_40632:3-3059(+)